MSDLQSLLQKSELKINVIGTSGSGKSTFAKKLSAVLGVPHIEMDQIFWKANWEQPSDDEFFAKLKTALAQPTWILDGNYNRTVPIKWEKIDLVIWLDYSFSLTLFQAIRRAASRAWSKEELWEGTGNRESFFKSFFSKKSIIWWTITTHKNVRTKYESYMRDRKLAHIQFVRLRNHAEAAQFIDSFKKSDPI